MKMHLLQLMMCIMLVPLVYSKSQPGNSHTSQSASAQLTAFIEQLKLLLVRSAKTCPLCDQAECPKECEGTRCFTGTIHDKELNGCSTTNIKNPENMCYGDAPEHGYCLKCNEEDGDCDDSRPKDKDNHCVDDAGKECKAEYCTTTLTAEGKVIKGCSNLFMPVDLPEFCLFSRPPRSILQTSVIEVSNEFTCYCSSDDCNTIEPDDNDRLSDNERSELINLICKMLENRHYCEKYTQELDKFPQVLHEMYFHDEKLVKGTMTRIVELNDNMGLQSISGILLMSYSSIKKMQELGKDENSIQIDPLLLAFIQTFQLERFTLTNGILFDNTKKYQPPPTLAPSTEPTSTSTVSPSTESDDEENGKKLTANEKQSEEEAKKEAKVDAEEKKSNTTIVVVFVVIIILIIAAGCFVKFRLHKKMKHAKYESVNG